MIFLTIVFYCKKCIKGQVSICHVQLREICEEFLPCSIRHFLKLLTFQGHHTLHTDTIHYTKYRVEISPW